MNVNLNKLDSMLDNALEKETTESLNEWIKTKEPLFTLTAEEVQYLKDDLIGKRFCRKLDEIEINLLTRIKQWL